MKKAGNDPYSTAIIQKSPLTLECHYDKLGTKIDVWLTPNISIVCKAVGSSKC